MNLECEKVPLADGTVMNLNDYLTGLSKSSFKVMGAEKESGSMLPPGQGGGVSDYEDLTSLPKINGVTLIGDNTDIAMKDEVADTYATKQSVEAIEQDITDLTSDKQDTLVSGTNIKTINNTSILGSGNIDIQGGSGTDDYDDLTNKPSINGVTLEGNKTTSDLHIQAGTSEYTKYVVIVVAGQSNAVGYDESIKTDYDKSINTNRIKQLGYKHNHNLEIVPLSYCAENFQNMDSLGTGSNGTKGIHLPLANLLVDYIPDDYGILMLPCAFGGTNFTSNTWNNYDADAMTIPDNVNQCSWGNGGTANTGNEYRCMKDRVKYVLDMNPDNKFLCVVWIQGEHGANNPANNNLGFNYISNDFMTWINDNYADQLPMGRMTKNMWINVETTGYWFDADTNKSGVQTIWKHYLDWNPDSYVRIPRTYDITNNVGGNASTTAIKPSHFGNNAYRTTIAPRVLRNMLDNGILLINGAYDKNDQTVTEEQFTNLTDVVLGIEGVLTNAGFSRDNTGEQWNDFTSSDWIQVQGTNATFSNNIIHVSDNSGILFTPDIKKIRWTEGVAQNKLYFLIVSSEDPTTGGANTNRQSLMLAFNAANSSKYIDNDTLNGTQDTGYTNAQREAFFGNGSGHTFTAEFKDNGILFTKEDATTILYPLPTKYTPRFGFKSYNGGSWGGNLTNVQYATETALSAVMTFSQDTDVITNGTYTLKIKSDGIYINDKKILTET